MRPLIDQALSVVFYDLTTIRPDGHSECSDEMRRYGPSKEGGIARQVMLGVVQTAEGLPIHHEVFEGNVAETHTLVPTIEKVLGRYPIQRVVLVADRGLLSLDNLQSLQGIRIHGRPLESRRRDQQIAALEADAARWSGKLNGQDEGQVYRGRKLSDGGVTARFYKAVSDARLGHLVKVDLTSQLFFYDIDERARERARMLDGKLVLLTNMADHSPTQIIERYKALADIERGFRVLKSEIEIAPVFHRRGDRIRAHALICFLALVLYRVLRLRLKDRHSPYSPERALEIARRVQFHQVTLHRHQCACGLSTLTPEQQDLFDTIDLPRPSAKRLSCQFEKSIGLQSVTY